MYEQKLDFETVFLKEKDNILINILLKRYMLISNEKSNSGLSDAQH